MSRETLVYRNGQWIDKRLAPSLPNPNRSSVACPMVIPDFKESVFSHADGRIYTSRKHWRDHLRAHGMVELGNDMPKGPKAEPALTPEAISEAYDQCVAGKGAKGSKAPPEGWQGGIDGV